MSLLASMSDVVAVLLMGYFLSLKIRVIVLEHRHPVE